MKSNVSHSPVWGDDVQIRKQPSLKGEIETDVLVIGMGGSGLAAMEEGLRLGKRVVGIDAGTIAGGAAGRNGGLLLAGLAKFYNHTVTQVGRERAKEMYQATLDQMKRMQDTTRNCIRNTGSIRIAEGDERFDCMLHMDALRLDGFEAEHYKGHEGQGILLPNDCVYQPIECCRQQMEQVLSGDAEIFENTPAIKIRSGMVKTPEGRIDCKHIVAAVDGRLEQLFPELGKKLTTNRLQMLATAPETDVTFSRPIYRRDGYDYLQQLPDKRVAMGGCRDKFPYEEMTNCADPSKHIQDAIETELRKLGVTAPVTHRWAASVSYARSNLPIGKEVKQGVYAVGAYNGTGNLVGRIMGRAAVQAAILGDRTLLDLFSAEAKPS